MTQPSHARVPALNESELNLLFQVTSAANHSVHVDEIAARTLEAIRAVLVFDLAFFLLIDPDRSRLQVVPPFTLPLTLASALEQLPVPAEFYAQTGTDPVSTSATVPLIDGIRTLLRQAGFVDHILVPLWADLRLIGLGTFAWPRDNPPPRENVIRSDVLEAIGVQIGIALERARGWERLEGSEEKYRGFVDNSPDGFCEYDAQGNLTFVNSAALKIIGYSREELEGRSVPTFIFQHPETEAQIVEQMQREGQVRDLRLIIRTKDGSIKTVNLTARLVQDEAGNPLRYQCAFRDVTARVQLENALARRNEELRVLNRIAGRLSYPTRIEDSLNEACDQLVSLTGLESVAILLLDQAHCAIDLFASRNVDTDLAQRFEHIDLAPEIFSPKYEAEKAHGLPEYLIAGKKTWVEPDLNGETRWNVDIISQAGYRSAIGSPIRFADEIFGVILVGSRTPHALALREAEVVENIALQLAVTLRNKYLYQSMQKQVVELKALARVVELLATGGNAKPILREVSIEVAKALGADSASIILRQGQLQYTGATSLSNLPLETGFVLNRRTELLNRNTPLVISNVQAEELEQPERELLKRLEISALVGMPLRGQKTGLGFLFVNQNRPRKWTEEDIRLITTFARQISSELENAQLMHELQARVRELSSFADMSTLAASLVPEETAIDLALDTIRELLKVDLVGVHLLDGDRFRAPYMRGTGIPPTEPLELTPELQNLFALREPFIFDSEHRVPPHMLAAGRIRRFNLQAAVVLPLLIPNAAIGILAVGHRTDHLWTEAEILSLRTFANQLSTAIVNGRLYQEQLDRAHRLKLLAELSQDSSAMLHAESLLQIAVDKVRSMLAASQVSIRLLDGEYLTIGVGSGYLQPELRQRRIRVDALMQGVLASQKPLPIANLATFPVSDPTCVERERKEGASAVLLVPMIARGEAVGVLAVYFATPHDWNEAEIHFAQTIANTVAISVSNAQLFESLQQEKRDAEMVLNSVFSGVFTTDREGVIQTWNRAAEDMTGHLASAMLGKKWPDLVRMNQNQPDELIFEAMEDNAIAFGIAPRTLMTAEGHEIPLTEAAAPLRDLEGGIRGAVGAFWDRTRENQAQRAKLDFLTEVSHELRNSLTVVIAMAGMLRDPSVRGATREHAIGKIAAETERLQDFTKRFLRFENEHFQEPVEQNIFEISDLMKHLVASVQAKYPELRFKMTLKTSEASADRARLATVLLNLIDNAAKYSPADRPVEIEVKPIPEAWVRIAVRNYGPVIPKEEIEHIFERGYRSPTLQQANKPVTGSGIGLWLVRKKLEEMGGEICVDSTAKGTTFYFTLRQARREHGKKQRTDSGRGRRQSRSRSSRRSA